MVFKISIHQIVDMNLRERQELLHSGFLRQINLGKQHMLFRMTKNLNVLQVHQPKQVTQHDWMEQVVCQQLGKTLTLRTLLHNQLLRKWRNVFHIVGKLDVWKSFPCSVQVVVKDEHQIFDGRWTGSYKGIITPRLGRSVVEAVFPTGSTITSIKLST